MHVLCYKHRCPSLVYYGPLVGGKANCTGLQDEPAVEGVGHEYSLTVRTHLFQAESHWLTLPDDVSDAQSHPCAHPCPAHTVPNCWLRTSFWVCRHPPTDS